MAARGCTVLSQDALILCVRAPPRGKLALAGFVTAVSVWCGLETFPALSRAATVLRGSRMQCNAI